MQSTTVWYLWVSHFVPWFAKANQTPETTGLGCSHPLELFLARSDLWDRDCLLETKDRLFDGAIPSLTSIGSFVFEGIIEHMHSWNPSGKTEHCDMLNLWLSSKRNLRSLFGFQGFGCLPATVKTTTTSAIFEIAISFKIYSGNWVVL